MARSAKTALDSAQIDNKLCSLLIARVRDYAIFMLDPSGKVMTWNDGARLIKGYTRDEIIGQPMSRFYTPEDRERGRPAALLREAVKNGRVEDEGWRVRKDGSRFWADVVITAVSDDQGQLIGFAKVTRDLTERRQAEAAIDDLSARLLRLQDEDRQRLAGQLHDRTSTSLTAVLGSLYRVKAHLKSADVVLLDDVTDSITKVQEASDVIRRVAYMLHPSRLEQGGLVETLRWYVNAVSGERLNLKAELPPEPVAIPRETEIVLFRFVQECLNYLVGGNGEREVIVRLSVKGGLILQIVINGSLPFALRDALASTQTQAGPGLTGVRERLRQLGGKVHLIGGDDHTIVEATLPRREA